MHRLLEELCKNSDKVYGPWCSWWALKWLFISVIVDEITMFVTAAVTEAGQWTRRLLLFRLLLCGLFIRFVFSWWSLFLLLCLFLQPYVSYVTAGIVPGIENQFSVVVKPCGYIIMWGNIFLLMKMIKQPSFHCHNFSHSVQWRVKKSCTIKYELNI